MRISLDYVHLALRYCCYALGNGVRLSMDSLYWGFVSFRRVDDVCLSYGR